MSSCLLRKNACTQGCRIRLKTLLETPQGVVAVRHVARTSCTHMARGRGIMMKRLEAPCHCGSQWISTGWTCNSCYNTGTAWCFLRRTGTCSYEIATYYREIWVQFHTDRWWVNQEAQVPFISRCICVAMIHIMERHRGQSCAKWMLQRVESHFGMEVVLPGSMPMTAGDDDLIEYKRSNFIPWLDKEFTLEIHVETLTGETKKLMHWTHCFEEGEDDWTMGDVLSWVKEEYPTPQNRRHMLALCDRVLDEPSTNLETPIRTYLHRYCRDYNSNSTELQLRCTLIFVNNIERSDNILQTGEPFWVN